MGNRPNEGYAEMTVCLYLPDGRVGFMFKRPRIEGHEAHDAGGLRFEVVAPYEEHHVTYDGTVCVLVNPREMADPKAAFADNPHEPCAIDLHLTAAAMPSGGEPEYDEGEEPAPGSTHSFARGHTEQQMAITGTVRLGDEEFVVTDGFGLRDHSWGPRVWQSISWYRWITASFGPLGIACTTRGDDDERRPSCQRPRVRRRPLRRHSSRYRCGTWSSRRSTTTSGSPPAIASSSPPTTPRYELHGEIGAAIPLRNRRERPGHPHHREHHPLDVRRARRRRAVRVPRPGRRWPPRRNPRRRLRGSRPRSSPRSARRSRSPSSVASPAARRARPGRSPRTARSSSCAGTRPVGPAQPGVMRREADAMRACDASRAARPGGHRLRRRRPARHDRTRDAARPGRDDRPPHPPGGGVRGGAPRARRPARPVPRRTPRHRPRAAARASRRPIPSASGTSTSPSTIAARPSTRRTSGCSPTAPRGRPTHVVHGDLRMGNLIVEPDRPGRGHRLGDRARRRSPRGPRLAVPQGVALRRTARGRRPRNDRRARRRLRRRGWAHGSTATRCTGGSPRRRSPGASGA